MVTEYDPETCITAGELRAQGTYDLPESIPDVAWVPKSAVTWTPIATKYDPETQKLDTHIAVNVTAEWKWVEVKAEQKL